MTVALSSPERFSSKLKSILDTAKQTSETAIVIMTDRSWHMEVFNFMKDHKGISRLKVTGTTYFIIKEMRIEIKPIDFYI